MVDNTATLTNPDVLITSSSGTPDPGPEAHTIDYPIDNSIPGDFTPIKTFDGIQETKTGSRSAARGEIVEASIMLQDNRTQNTFVGVCDTLDTDYFEFAGAIGAGQLDGILHGATSYNSFALEPTINDHRRATHGTYNIFLGQQNWLKLYNDSATTQTVTISVNQLGIANPTVPLGSTILNLAPGQGIDAELSATLGQLILTGQ